MKIGRHRVTSTQAAFLGIAAGWVFLLGVLAGMGKLSADLLIFAGISLSSIGALLASTSKSPRAAKQGDCGKTRALATVPVDRN
jgi:hypothetical protein